MYESSRFVAPLLTEVGQRLGLTLQEIVWFTVPELIGAIRGSSLARSQLAERQQGFALLTNVHAGAVITGPDLTALKQAIHLVERTDTSELRGQSAYPGVVRGQVRIIHDLKDLHLVEPGEVLVAPSTTPAFVPALRKVAAVITEEGGVLCHAAMVARELKVPIVIGVRSATTVLTDGDVIEVDGTTGQIRKERA